MVRQTGFITALALATALAAPGFSRAAQADGPRLLVIPFSTLNVDEDQMWIGRAIEENIIADFGHSNTFAPIAFQGQLLVEDNATAVALAHKANADLVIRGAAQRVDKSLRITAQMIDARTGDSVTTASVTGSASDLLKLEDELSAQLRSNAVAAQQQQPQQQAAPQPTDAAGPITYTPNPVYAAPTYAPAYTSAYTPGYSYPAYTTTYAPAYYDYGYSYPYSCYDYGYPTFSFGASYGFGGRGFSRGFDHDRDDFRGDRDGRSFGGGNFHGAGSISVPRGATGGIGGIGNGFHGGTIGGRSSGGIGGIGNGFHGGSIGGVGSGFHGGGLGGVGSGFHGGGFSGGIGAGGGSRGGSGGHR